MSDNSVSGFERFKRVAVEIISAKYSAGKRLIDDDDIEDIKRALKRPANE